MKRFHAHLEQTVIVRATPELVFRFVTDSDRFETWWGAGSSILPRKKGAVHIRFSNGVTVSGEIFELAAGRRIGFSYGYDAPDKPIPPGGSRVRLQFEPHPEGTLVTLHHDFLDAETCDKHVAGWRYQLATLATLASKLQHAELDQVIDRFFAVWAITDASARRRELEQIVGQDFEYRDRYACAAGREAFHEYVAAYQIHAHDDEELHRTEQPTQCQGRAIVKWEKVVDGLETSAGLMTFDLAGDGRLRTAVAFD